ncbi:MAG: hypothetical protein ACKOYN_00180 [Planctomycetota bacterium]
MPQNQPSAPWHWSSCIAFRFLFASFLLAFGPALIGAVPFLGGAGAWVDEAVQPFYAWVAHAAFGLEITVFPNGSGDTTYNWVQFAANLAMASVVASAWSALDRRRASYPWAKDGLWIAMRFTLASAMFGYGLAKVYCLQFPEPGVHRLLQSYGDSSPMGLMWTFMGASEPYQMFAGWMEVAGGLLLCFRRTQLAGALVTAGVMTNVFVLNMCYDIPVKLYSFQLLALALVIAAPDVPRLVRLFALNRPVPRADLRGPWTRSALRRAATTVKFLWIAATLVALAFEMADQRKSYGDAAPRGPLDGTWEVVGFRRDGVEIPPLATEATRWRFVTLIDLPEFAQVIVRPMAGTDGRWLFARNGEVIELREMTVAAGGDRTKARLAGTITAVPEGADGLRVSGEVEGSRIEAVCTRRSPKDFLLRNRGFRWVNEFPFNR